MVLSVYLPVAVNGWVLPAGTVGLAVATVIEASGAAVTLRVVVPLTLPMVAVALILVVPAPTPVARPPAVIVAIVVLLAQMTETEVVTSILEPSE